MADSNKPKVMHVISHFGQGGTEVAVLTLVKEGFYKDVDMHLVALAQGSGAYRKEFTAELGSSRVSVLSSRFFNSRRHIPESAWRLSKKISDIKPSAVIFSAPETQVAGGIALRRFPDITNIRFEHFASNWSRIRTLALKLTSGGVDAVFGDTPESLVSSQRYVHPLGQPRHEVPIIIAEPGTPRAPEQPKTFNLLSVGRLHSQKNFDELLKAVAILKNESRNLSLTIAGEGDDRAALEMAAVRLGIKDCVRMPGWSDNVKALHGGAHIYVQPSLHEGLCLATVEALAAGVPTVATDFGGTRDYGRDRANFMKVAGYKAEGIANTIRELMDHYSDLAPALSAKAIDSMQELFGRSAVTAKWRVAANILTLPREKLASFQPSPQSVAAPPEHLSPKPPKSHVHPFG